MSATLSKIETSILITAASHPGRLIEVPAGTKPSSRNRLLGRFLKEGWVVEYEGGAHRLTPEGYKAVGLRPPRKPKPKVADSSATVPAGSGPGRPGTKLALVLELLSRPDGATLGELIAVTGWLPHTTRAALSRIRSAGQALFKSSRPDGLAAYCIEEASGPIVSSIPEQAKEDAVPDLVPPMAHARSRRRKARPDEVGAAA